MVVFFDFFMFVISEHRHLKTDLKNYWCITDWNYFHRNFIIIGSVCLLCS